MDAITWQQVAVFAIAAFVVCVFLDGWPWRRGGGR